MKVFHSSFNAHPLSPVFIVNVRFSNYTDAKIQD